MNDEHIDYIFRMKEGIHKSVVKAKMFKDVRTQTQYEHLTRHKPKKSIDNIFFKEETLYLYRNEESVYRVSAIVAFDC
jgi:hypothetical protein